MRRTRIRCSALPALLVCPGSARPLDVEIAPVSEAADAGTAGHDVMKEIVERDAGSLDGIDTVAIARRRGIDPDELRARAFVGLQVWRELRPSFRDAQAEVELRAEIQVAPDHVVELTGHIDAMSLDRPRRRANVADWKFGVVDRNYRAQLSGYAYLAMANYPDVEEVCGFVAWMREREVEPWVFTEDDMMSFQIEVSEKIAKWDGVYHPGPQCNFCRASHACPARLEMAKRDVEILGGADMRARIEAGLRDLPDAEVVELKRRAKGLRKIMDDLDEAIALRVREAGGVLADGAGRELRFVEEQRRRIDTALAFPILERWLTDEEMSRALDVKPSRLDEIVADKTPRGQKGKKIEELRAELLAAGALITAPVEKLMDVRTRKEPSK